MATLPTSNSLSGATGALMLWPALAAQRREQACPVSGAGTYALMKKITGLLQVLIPWMLWY